MNKKNTVIVTVVGVIALIIAVIGATYAYFTAQVRYVGPPGGSDVVARAATLGEITFSTNSRLELNNAFPGDFESRTFTVSADSNATHGVEYEIRIRITENNFENINKHHPDSFPTRDFSNLQITGRLVGGFSMTLGSDPAFGSVPFPEFGNGPGYVRENQVGDFLFGSALIYPGEVHEWEMFLTLNLLETRRCNTIPPGCPPAPMQIEQFNTNFDQGKRFSATIEVVTTGQYTSQNRPLAPTTP